MIVVIPASWPFMYGLCPNFLLVYLEYRVSNIGAHIGNIKMIGAQPSPQTSISSYAAHGVERDKEVCRTQRAGVCLRETICDTRCKNSVLIISTISRKGRREREREGKREGGRKGGKKEGRREGRREEKRGEGASYQPWSPTRKQTS